MKETNNEPVVKIEQTNPQPRTQPKKKKTKKVLRKVPYRKSKRVTGIKMILASMLLIPLFTYLFIISLNSNKLINKPLSMIILILDILSIGLFFLGLLMKIKNKKIKTGKKVKTWFKVCLGIFITCYIGLSTTVIFLLYGPYDGFRNWLIPTAMTTMNHQYFATWFYDDEYIEKILNDNVVIESGEDSDPDQIKIEPKEEIIYENEYEEAVLKKDEGNELYKIIDINRDGYKGKLAVIYDPSKVKIAPSTGLGTSLSNSYGQMLTTISKNNKAVIATNAGGFYDPNWNSSGGVPHGAVIVDGKLVANNSRAVGVGGIIGFDKNNKLILGRMTAKEALARGIRDAVDFGPFLIVNGKSSFIKGNGGWGEAPRTAIGQRKDGIVLLLVIDGRQVSSRGADMNDLAEVMQLYGAYNASNLDGGTSSAMTLNHKIITNPRNGSFKPKTRAIPNAWIVVE